MINKYEILKAKATADEAKSIYEAMKIDALSEIIKAMAESGKEYTAAELAEFSGLNTSCIATNFNAGPAHSSAIWKALNKIGFNYNIRSGTRVEEYTYVKINRDGSYDTDKKINVKQTVTTYRVDRVQ